jgi:hypothetical protein
MFYSVCSKAPWRAEWLRAWDDSKGRGEDVYAAAPRRRPAGAHGRSARYISLLVTYISVSSLVAASLTSLVVYPRSWYLPVSSLVAASLERGHWRAYAAVMRLRDCQRGLRALTAA